MSVLIKFADSTVANRLKAVLHMTEFLPLVFGSTNFASLQNNNKKVANVVLILGG